MKSLKSPILILFILLVTCTFIVSSFTPVFADTDESLEDYISQCNAPEELYDPEAMAKTIANPEKFTQFIIELSKPATTKAFMQCIVTPEQWETMAVSMTNPYKMMNAMIPFVNPQTYFAWMTASMDPQTYQAFVNYMNPIFYMQWMAAIMNTEIYQPMFSMIDSTDFISHTKNL